MTSQAGMTFYGAPLAWAGRTVSVWCAGLYMGDYTINADGSVGPVPYASDPGAFGTASYFFNLIAPSGGWGPLASRFFVWYNSTDTIVTLPVVIGSKFTSQGQLLPPDAIVENRSPFGPGPAKKRRIHRFGAKLSRVVWNTIQFGTNFTNMHYGLFRSAGGTASAYNALWTGMWWDSIPDDYSSDAGQLAWQIQGPYPAAISSMTGFIHMAEQ